MQSGSSRAEYCGTPLPVIKYNKYVSFIKIKYRWITIQRLKKNYSKL